MLLACAASLPFCDVCLLSRCHLGGSFELACDDLLLQLMCLLFASSLLIITLHRSDLSNLTLTAAHVLFMIASDGSHRG